MRRHPEDCRQIGLQQRHIQAPEIANRGKLLQSVQIGLSFDLKVAYIGLLFYSGWEDSESIIGTIGSENANPGSFLQRDVCLKAMEAQR